MLDFLKSINSENSNSSNFLSSLIISPQELFKIVVFLEMLRIFLQISKKTTILKSSCGEIIREDKKLDELLFSKLIDLRKSNRKQKFCDWRLTIWDWFFSLLVYKLCLYNLF